MVAGSVGHRGGCPLLMAGVRRELSALEVLLARWAEGESELEPSDRNDS